jgi:hypothetical protein
MRLVAIQRSQDCAPALVVHHLGLHVDEHLRLVAAIDLFDRCHMPRYALDNAPQFVASTSLFAFFDHGRIGQQASAVCSMISNGGGCVTDAVSHGGGWAITSEWPA